NGVVSCEDQCCLDMLKLFEVDSKIHWKFKAPGVAFTDELDTVGKQKGRLISCALTFGNG
ncbi:hypothetical protein Tco_0636488, partial [Tanacetum coccineum]